MAPKRSTLALAGYVALAAWACGPPTQANLEPNLVVRRNRPHPKPGASITKTEMCSCIVCEPVSCCHEMAADQPEPDADCADDYDFSECEMAVSSCESNCFRHRWRTEVAVGCDRSRPDRCCHEQAAF